MIILLGLFFDIKQVLCRKARPPDARSIPERSTAARIFWALAR